MNCTGCGHTIYAAFPGGRCAKCHKAQSVRRCRCCKAVLERNRFEFPYHFARRTTCSDTCSNALKRQRMILQCAT
jgi:hypothetical protein